MIHCFSFELVRFAFTKAKFKRSKICKQNSRGRNVLLLLVKMFRRVDSKSVHQSSSQLYIMERLLIFALILIWSAYTQTLLEHEYGRLVEQRALNNALIYAFRQRRRAIRRSYRRRRQLMRAYHDVFATQAGPVRYAYNHKLVKITK